MMIDCKKKSRAVEALLQKLCRPYFSREFGFGVDWRGDAAFLRARVPPETWTTRPLPCGEPDAKFVDHLSCVVTIFSNECSNFMQFEKRLEIAHPELHTYALICYMVL
jgi:hypothetical protein